jgi:2'-5' RNA ligase
MKRIFVAIDISDEARSRTAQYVESLRKDFPRLRVGWDKPEKLHLTLKFLGDTTEMQLDKLQNIVEEISKKIERFSLQIAETGVFPSPQKARVLWIDVVDKSGNLAKINSFLETECEKIGFSKEKRNYKPHLTIARLREPQFSDKLVKSHLENNFEPVGFEISEIAIYESKLQPTGSIYTKLKTYQLKN